MDTIASYDDLVAFFSETGLLHQSEPTESMIKLPIKKEPLDAMMFIRWQSDFEVVHFIQGMNLEVSDERLPALALAIAMLNHALPMPGFGINTAARSCYFRITMPRRPDGTLLKNEIHGLFNLAVQTASEHLPALREVAQNGAEPMTVMQ